LKQKEKLFTWQVITAYNRPLALLGIKLSSKTSVPFGTWLLSHLLQQLKQKMLMKGKRCANLKNRTATSQMLGTLYAIITEHRQIREKDKRKVGASLTGMDLLLQMKKIIIVKFLWF